MSIGVLLTFVLSIITTTKGMQLFMNIHRKFCLIDHPLKWLVSLSLSTKHIFV